MVGRQCAKEINHQAMLRPRPYRRICGAHKWPLAHCMCEKESGGGETQRFSKPQNSGRRRARRQPFGPHLVRLLSVLERAFCNPAAVAYIP